jgi:hypothetical protein
VLLKVRPWIELTVLLFVLAPPDAPAKMMLAPLVGAVPLVQLPAVPHSPELVFHV